MPPPKIDPVEAWHTAGSSLIGRIFLFFSAGWFGLGLGQVANGFSEWKDFLTPWYAFDEMFAGGLFAFVFWPITVFFLAKVPVILILALIGLGAAFFVFIYTEEPAPFWWLVIAAIASLGPVVGDVGHEFSLSSWIVLAFFWIGLGFAGWWALRKWHPEIVEKGENLLQGSDHQPRPQFSRRKAPPDTWGEPVKGWDGDEEDQEEASKEDDDRDGKTLS